MGQTVVDSMNFYRRSPNALVLTQTYPLKFFRLFFSRLLGMAEEDLDLLPVLLKGVVS